MKKIFTLLFALTAFVSHSMAQHGPMKFVGKASFSVLTTTVNVESDILVYSGSDLSCSGHLWRLWPVMAFSMRYGLNL